MLPFKSTCVRLRFDIKEIFHIPKLFPLSLLYWSEEIHSANTNIKIFNSHKHKNIQTT